MRRILLLPMLIGLALGMLLGTNQAYGQAGTNTFAVVSSLASPKPFNMSFPYLSVQVQITSNATYYNTYDRIELVYKDSESVFATRRSQVMQEIDRVGDTYTFEALLPVYAGDVRILEEVRVEANYCSPNFYSSGSACAYLYYGETFSIHTNGAALIRMTEFTDPINCAVDPHTVVGKFTELTDATNNCAIFLQDPTATEIVFNQGQHILVGDRLHGVEIIDDIRVNAGAQVFIESTHFVALRGNIVVEPGGFLQVRSRMVALDNSEEGSSIPSNSLTVHHNAQFRAYAEDLLFVTTNTYVYGGLLRLVGNTVRLYPRFLLGEFLVAEQGTAEVEFCEELDQHHTLTADGATISLYSPNEEGSFIITYSDMEVKNEGAIYAKAGKVFKRGNVMAQEFGGLISIETTTSVVLHGAAFNGNLANAPVPEVDFGGGPFATTLGFGDAQTFTEVAVYAYITDPKSCPESYDYLAIPTGQRPEGEAMNLETERVPELEVYPNPMQEQATVRYRLTETTPLRFVVYDLQGRAVYLSDPIYREAGEHTWAWNVRSDEGESLPAGSYMLVLQTRQGWQSLPIRVH